MLLLAIDTATRQLGVALSDGSRLLASYELVADNPHAVELPDAVHRVLRAAQVTFDRVEAVAVDIGPGSFTGLRIGMAFVKALAFARQIPVTGIPSLDLLAANVPCASHPVYPILDARQRNVYAARYRLESGRWVRETAYLLGPLAEVFPRHDGPVICLGDGCALYRDRILERCPQAQWVDPELWLPNTAALARLGHERLAAGQRDDPATLVPLYLYPLDCSVRGPDRPTSVLPTATSAA